MSSSDERRDETKESSPVGVPRFLPPHPKNMVEFVVEVFVITISLMMVLSLLGLFVLTFTRPETNLGQAFNSLADIMTTIIGALIGFVAGRGQGHAEGLQQTVDIQQSHSQQRPPPRQRASRPRSLPDEMA